MPRNVNPPLQLWASRRAAELIRSEGDVCAVRQWAMATMNVTEWSGAPYTLRSPKGTFYLHLRPAAGLALLYTEACDTAEALSRMEEALFRRLLAYCEKVDFDPTAPHEELNESHSSK